MKKKECNTCHEIKPLSEYYHNYMNNDSYEYLCKVCSGVRYRRAMENAPKKIDDHFLYGEGDVMKKKDYLDDRSRLFELNGHGWWWNMDVNTFSAVTAKQYGDRCTR